MNLITCINTKIFKYIINIKIHINEGQKKKKGLTLRSILTLEIIKLRPTCVLCCAVTQSCLTLCDPMDCSPPGSSVHGDSPGKNTGVGCHALLHGHGDFPTKGSNPGLTHCRWILYQLSYQGSQRPT